MKASDFCKRINLVCGHYGSGKTNLAVNLALRLREQGGLVTLVDLDIVNPYFRSADFTRELGARGIRTVNPVFAGSNLDMPSLTAEFSAAFEQENGHVILDVGGDDAGAAALGRYAALVPKQDTAFFYVINQYRYLTRTPSEAAALLRDIETASRLKATALVNNSNLGDQTTAQTVLTSGPFAQSVADLTGLPLAVTAYDEALEPELTALGGVKQGFPVQIYVKPPWETKNPSL